VINWLVPYTAATPGVDFGCESTVRLDREIDWFALKRGEYRLIPAGPKGVLKSLVFPGLWLDPSPLIRGDLKEVLRVLGRGLRSPEHRAFAARLERRGRRRRGRDTA
jgi:hypothetical protein